MRRILNKLIVLNSIPIFIGLLLIPFDSLRGAYTVFILPILLLAINSNHSYYNKKGNFWPNIFIMCIISIFMILVDYLVNSIKSGNTFNPGSWGILYYEVCIFFNLLIILSIGIVLKNSLEEKFNTKE